MALGLVSRVVPNDKVMQTARELAGVFCGKPRDVMRLGRQAFKAAGDPTYRASISAAVDNFCHVASLPDAKEGFAAFAQKRKPQWRN
jgi:enoyl-CoA hydratase/carnithine racemase